MHHVHVLAHLLMRSPRWPRYLLPHSSNKQTRLHARTCMQIEIKINLNRSENMFPMSMHIKTCISVRIDTCEHAIEDPRTCRHGGNGECEYPTFRNRIPVNTPGPVVYGRENARTCTGLRKGPRTCAHEHSPCVRNDHTGANTTVHFLRLCSDATNKPRILLIHCATKLESAGTA